MKKDFLAWLNTFTDTIATYDYFTDFNLAYRNVEKLKDELNLMNSLIGSKNIEQDFDRLVRKYPEIIKCIPLLLAVRLNEITVKDEDKKITYKFIKTEDPNKLKHFMKMTGLFDLIANHLISNLVDYATGVEVGLGSNGRKNRGGHLMEDRIEHEIQKVGFIKNKNYWKEMYLEDIERKWNLNLSQLSNAGKAAKRFDFVLQIDKDIYAIETNFYASPGSKLNETARSYKMLAQESKNIDGFHFVWITDGLGWKTAQHNLEETYDTMDYLFNLNDLNNLTIDKLLKK